MEKDNLRSESEPSSGKPILADPYAEAPSHPQQSQSNFPLPLMPSIRRRAGTIIDIDKVASNESPPIRPNEEVPSHQQPDQGSRPLPLMPSIRRGAVLTIVSSNVASNGPPPNCPDEEVSKNVAPPHQQPDQHSRPLPLMPSIRSRAGTMIVSDKVASYGSHPNRPNEELPSHQQPDQGFRPLPLRLSIRCRAGPNINRPKIICKLRLRPPRRKQGAAEPTEKSQDQESPSSRKIPKIRIPIRKLHSPQQRINVNRVTSDQQRFRVRHLLATQVTVSRLQDFQSNRPDLILGLSKPVRITEIFCKTLHSMKVELEKCSTLSEVLDRNKEKFAGASPVVVWFDDRGGASRLERARANYRRFTPGVSEEEWRAERYLLFLLSQRICFTLGKYNRCDQTDLRMCRTILDMVDSDVIHNTSGVIDPLGRKQLGLMGTGQDGDTLRRVRN